MGIFRFKKFTVCDDRASMKVGTDGVLLGAWADVNGVNTILDVGTGSGIIALMLAQRSHENTLIDAVELQKEDSSQAIENVNQSPWSTRISVINTRIQDFSNKKKYDLIVCNPPYFSKSLPSPVKNRTQVRHDIELTFDDLIAATTGLLASNGKFCVILPSLEGDSLIQKAAASKLFLNRLTKFFTRSEKRQERSLMQFGFAQSPLVEKSLTLYQSGNEWTKEYAKLMEDFYLDRHT